jgi:hypothetical protein
MVVHVLLISYKFKLTAHKAGRVRARAYTAAALCLLTSNSYLRRCAYHPNRHLLHVRSRAIRLNSSSCHRRRAIPKRRRGLFVGIVLYGCASAEGSVISKLSCEIFTSGTKENLLPLPLQAISQSRYVLASGY